LRRITVFLFLAAAAAAAAISINDWLSVNGTNEAVYLRQYEDGRRWTWDILQSEVRAWRFAVGGEAEFDHPRRPLIQDPNSIGVEGDKVVQRYARYHDDVFDVWAGNYDETFGKGLTLRSYRDRDFEIYQQLDGGMVDASVPVAGREWGNVTALWGRNVHDEEFQEKEDTVAGGQFTFKPVDFAYVTGSGVKADVENVFNHEMEENKLFGGGLGGGWRYFDVYGEYATRKSYDSLLQEDVTGDGLYGVVTGYLPRSSLSVEYKLYDHLSYAYNNPPPVSHKEKMLTGANEPSEWGYYVQGTANPVTDVRVRGGYNYADNKVGDVEEKTAEIEEYFGEVRYDLPWPVYVQGGYDSISDLTFIGDVKSGDIRATPSLLVGWTPWDAHSFTGEFEREERTDYTNEGRIFVYNRANAGYTYSSWLGLTVSYEDTDQRARELVDPGAQPRIPAVYRFKNNWLWGEVRLMWYSSTFQNHVLTLGYGSQRGGLVCSSGVCKEQAPFSGLKVALESSF
jgi:hypothetical protein